MNILIADDSEITKELVSNEISRLEFVDQIWLADDGVSAYEAYQLHNPDVVILDIKMPGESGLEVLKKIKELSAASLVIVYTFYPYPQHRERALATGADYFFDKSKDFQKLLDTLRQIGET